MGGEGPGMMVKGRLLHRRDPSAESGSAPNGPHPEESGFGAKEVATGEFHLGHGLLAPKRVGLVSKNGWMSVRGGRPLTTRPRRASM
jgi:hypothetical protein